jgi:hypothetical protein
MNTVEGIRFDNVPQYLTYPIWKQVYPDICLTRIKETIISTIPKRLK